MSSKRSDGLDSEQTVVFAVQGRESCPSVELPGECDQPRGDGG